MFSKKGVLENFVKFRAIWLVKKNWAQNQAVELFEMIEAICCFNGSRIKNISIIAQSCIDILHV